MEHGAAKSLCAPFRSRSAYALLSTLLAGVLCLSGTIGGTSGCGSCDCRQSGLYIDVPAERIADVATVVASGDTCHTNPPICEMSPGPGCNYYRIPATEPGHCHVVITFTSGAAPVTTDVDFEANGGCCGGLNPRIGQNDFAVPPLVSQSDGGDSGG